MVIMSITSCSIHSMLITRFIGATSTWDLPGTWWVSRQTALATARLVLLKDPNKERADLHLNGAQEPQGPGATRHVRTPGTLLHVTGTAEHRATSCRSYPFGYATN